MDKCTRYIYNNIRSLFTLRSYTYRGDEIVNAYLRKSTKNYRMILQNIRISGKEIPFSYIIYDNYDFLKKAGLIMPEKDTLISSDKINIEPLVIIKLFNDNFKFFVQPHILNKLMADYSKELYNIIVNAPRIPYDITVYRGRKSEQSLPPGIVRFKEKSFISTSLNIRSVFKFMELHTKYICCLYKINIKKGTPCLYVNDVSKVENEFEVLLPYNIVFSHQHVLKEYVHDGIPIIMRSITAEKLTTRDITPTRIRISSTLKSKGSRKSKKSKFYFPNINSFETKKNRSKGTRSTRRNHNASLEKIFRKQLSMRKKKRISPLINNSYIDTFSSSEL